jgi:DNA-binding transcriptional regulator GbsR (MarR family)
MPEASIDPNLPEDVAAARVRAVGLVADTFAELMRFWNFKPSMGRIWAVLYLSEAPVDAAGIERATGLSAGQVSTTLQELEGWGVVRKGFRGEGGARRRVFAAETDILAMVARVFRERELLLVERSIAQLEEALALLEGAGRGQDEGALQGARFLAGRVAGLLALVRTGHGIVQQLSRTGSADLSGLRGALAERVRGRVGSALGRVAGRLA